MNKSVIQVSELSLFQQEMTKCNGALPHCFNFTPPPRHISASASSGETTLSHSRTPRSWLGLFCGCSLAFLCMLSSRSLSVLCLFPASSLFVLCLFPAHSLPFLRLFSGSCLSLLSSQCETPQRLAHGAVWICECTVIMWLPGPLSALIRK